MSKQHRFLKTTRRQIHHLLIDLWELLLNRLPPMTPPRRWIPTFQGSRREFHRSGQNQRDRIVQQCNMRPNQRILDVGCGAGRLAVALTQFLSEQGSYEGFDPHQGRILWCQKSITPKFPHFRFTWANVSNGAFNPSSRVSASTYRFPYPNQSFDVVTLLSVFTHMLPEEVVHYFLEIARVLKPGGLAYITYFLINPWALTQLREKNSVKPHFRNLLKQNHGTYRTAFPKTHEALVAYPESNILQLYGQAGFVIQDSIQYGNWCGRETPFLQDVIVSVKS